MTASGTFGYAREFSLLVDLNRLGAIVVKGLALKPVKGNRPPRIVETACGMLNAIGLENVGIDAFEAEKLPFLRSLTPPIIANIYGTTVDEYAALAERIDAIDGVAGVEVNISCPNVKAGGVVFGVDPQAAAGVVKAVRQQDPQDRHREALAERHRHHADRAQRGGCRGRRAFPDQHPHRHGDRHRNPAAAAGQHHRRAVRPGHPAGGRAHGVAGGAGGAGAGDRHRRDHEGRGCDRVFHRRRVGRSDRHRQFHQPARRAGHLSTGIEPTSQHGIGNRR